MIHRWLLRVTAVVLSLSAALLVVGGAVYHRNARERHRSLREWNDARCAVFRRAAPDAADPCARGGEVRRWRREASLVHGDVEAARRAVALGDDDQAARRLSAALARARSIERVSSTSATIGAADGVAAALDVLDDAPGLKARSDLRAALAATELRTAAHPLAIERLYTLALELEDPPPLAFATWGLSDTRLSERAERRDAILSAMERSARQGDLAGCQRAARSGKGDQRLGTVLCEKAVKVASTSRRLARARASAL